MMGISTSDFHVFHACATIHCSGHWKSFKCVINNNRLRFVKFLLLREGAVKPSTGNLICSIIISRQLARPCFYHHLSRCNAITTHSTAKPACSRVCPSNSAFWFKQIFFSYIIVIYCLRYARVSSKCAKSLLTQQGGKGGLTWLQCLSPIYTDSKVRLDPSQLKAPVW